MSDRSPAFMLSLTLHAAVVAVLLFLSYAASPGNKEKPQVFELVAGAGDNYMATAAPALGSPGGVKLDLPAPAQPESSSRILNSSSTASPFLSGRAPMVRVRENASKTERSNSALPDERLIRTRLIDPSAPTKNSTRATNVSLSPEGFSWFSFSRSLSNEK